MRAVHDDAWQALFEACMRRDRSARQRGNGQKEIVLNFCKTRKTNRGTEDRTRRKPRAKDAALREVTQRW